MYSVTRFNAWSGVSTVARRLGNLIFHGMTIQQYDEYPSTEHADEEQNSLECFPLSRIRRREGYSPLTALKTPTFRSISSSFGYLGITTLPLCAFYASNLQQKCQRLLRTRSNHITST